MSADPLLTPDVLAEIERRLDPAARLLPGIGRRLVEMQSGDLDIATKSNARDLVTAADLYSEKTLADFIKNDFPQDSILAEESGGTDAAAWRRTVESAEFCWVLDPLDGTVNYSHGIPLYSISVGLVHRGRPVGGLVFAPAMGDFFRAAGGQGATLNGKQLRVSRVAAVRDAMVVTGFPYNREQHIVTLMKGVETMMYRAQGLRRTGSATLDLCWCAAGRFDAFYEFTLNPWDTCAGLVILQEAGGRITGVRGQPFEIYNPAIVATNGLIHDEFVAALADVPWQD